MHFLTSTDGKFLSYLWLFWKQRKSKKCCEYFGRFVVIHERACSRDVSLLILVIYKEACTCETPWKGLPNGDLLQCFGHECSCTRDDSNRSNLRVKAFSFLYPEIHRGDARYLWGRWGTEWHVSCRSPQRIYSPTLSLPTHKSFDWNERRTTVGMRTWYKPKNLFTSRWWSTYIVWFFSWYNYIWFVGFYEID